MTAAIDRLGGDSAAGIGYSVAAYTLWGFLPLYLKMLDHLGAVEVVAHRVVWSVPVASAILLALGRGAEIGAALRSPRTMAAAALTAALVSINWAIYVWAVANERTVDAALGYYINPLFSIFLGAVLLGERLSRLQTVAVGLAALAVLVLTLDAGRLPLVSLGLVVSWGFYAYCKRLLPVGPNIGFLAEVAVLAPVALGVLVWLETTGAGGMARTPVWLLAGAGVVTAVPLMLYANGAKRLRLSTIAILQYIAPTLILLVAVVVFGEELDAARRIALPMIWAALALYSWSLLRR